MDSPLITIRRATQDDAPAIQSLHNEVIAAGNAFVAEAAKSLDEIRAHWLTLPIESFVAQDTTSGEIVGAYLIKPNFPGRGAHIANATYVVKHNQQGRGIGRLLGTHSLDYARQAGYRGIQFNAVVSTNHAAVALWESLGFTRIATVPAAFRVDDDRYVDLYIMFQAL